MQTNTCVSAPISTQTPTPASWSSQCLEPIRRFIALRSAGRLQLLPAAPTS